jgi:hypothetical protein
MNCDLCHHFPHKEIAVVLLVQTEKRLFFCSIWDQGQDLSNRFRQKLDFKVYWVFQILIIENFHCQFEIQFNLGL